ncbi:hypothetical protein [Luteirhabdus pelagi]|uniref:hypothetical protein n=1 Tax=Luteirhabdus pelagi TaxID=2792783 RepID=UPI0019398853|nr:hypothetical protein [Luteirhabdus pelagi]
MKILFIVSLLFLGILVSCDDQNETVSQEATDIETQEMSFTTEAYSLPKVSPSVQELTSEWGAFEDFEAEVKRLRNPTLAELREESDRLLTRTDSLQKKIPDTLFTKPVEARVRVTFTRAKLLYQEAYRIPPDSAAVQNALKEMFDAASHLITQLNEKIQKDAIDLQRVESEQEEIKKQRRKRDSILQLEIQDNSGG